MMRWLVTCCAFLATPAAAQDVFLFNVSGYTEQYGAFGTFDALLIKDGRVQAVGTQALLRPYAASAVQRDMGGQTILPGFVHASDVLSGACAALEPKDIQTCVLDVLRQRMRSGFTFVQDSATSPPVWAALETLRDAQTLPMRVYGVLDGFDGFYAEKSADGPYVGTYKGLLALRAISLSGGDRCGAQSPAAYSPVAQRNRIARAVLRGYQVRLSARSSDQFVDVLSAYEDVISIAGSSGRHVIAPMEMVDATLAPRLTQSGLIVVLGWCGGDVSKSAGSFNALLAQGVDMALAANAPFEAIEQLARSASGPQVRQAALLAATKGSAYAAFVEESVGSLETGRWADFIVVDQDIFTVKADDISKTQVLETWVAGRQVYNARD